MYLDFRQEVTHIALVYLIHSALPHISSELSFKVTKTINHPLLTHCWLCLVLSESSIFHFWTQPLITDHTNFSPLQSLLWTLSLIFPSLPTPSTLAISFSWPVTFSLPSVTFGRSLASYQNIESPLNFAYSNGSDVLGIVLVCFL